MRRKNYSLRDIGAVLNRSDSSICEELKRNKVRNKYDPQKANHKAYVRRKYSKYQGMKIVADSRLQRFVEEKLYDDQSPVNVAGRIKKHERNLLAVSKNSIYRYITSPYGRRIREYLDKRKNGKRKNNRYRSFQLQNRIFIENRPEIINKRARIGDVESDFLVSGKSGKGIILVVTDRKSRAPFLERIVNVSKNNINLAFQDIKKRFPEMRTLTTDNDILLQHHEELARLLKIKIYFCNPYHSWEKGTVENTNKYIRKDIPKSSDISKYSKQFIHSLELKLQRRIMECLNYLTPLEVLNNQREQKKRLSAKKNK